MSSCVNKSSVLFEVVYYKLLTIFFTHPRQCYLAAIQNTSPPSRQPFYSGHPGSTVPPQPTNGVSPPPGNVPEPPPPPSSAAVDNDDGEFEDDLHCYVLYDFQGKICTYDY